jgi:hypothetical protein
MRPLLPHHTQRSDTLDEKFPLRAVTCTINTCGRKRKKRCDTHRCRQHCLEYIVQNAGCCSIRRHNPSLSYPRVFSVLRIAEDNRTITRRLSNQIQLAFVRLFSWRRGGIELFASHASYETILGKLLSLQ